MTDAERAASEVDPVPVPDAALEDAGKRLVAAHNDAVALEIIARLAALVDLPIPALAARCERQRREMHAAQEDIALLTAPTPPTTH